MSKRVVKAYGGLMNRIMETSTGPVPEVGMGATKLGWSDRHAGTITKVGPFGKNPVGRVTWQMDRSKRTDDNGISECQDYEYTPDPEGADYTFTLRKDGTYVREGESLKHGTRLSLGHRNTYRDPSH